ncbi:MAG: 30S ribosomal protein S1 [Bacteroidia bacterium]|nr:30S ribosomal protein S1 [Bacteroidia bacterium]
MVYKPNTAQTILIKQLAIDDELDCKVIKITRTGVVVQHKIITGIIRLNDLTYGRFTSVDDYIKLNQKLKAKVLSIDDNLQIQFGLKQMQPHPWQQVTAKFKPGMFVVGTVVSIQEYGAFLMLIDGVEGLLHKKQIPDLNGKTTYEYFVLDEVYQVMITEIDLEKKRIALALPVD